MNVSGNTSWWTSSPGGCGGAMTRLPSTSSKLKVNLHGRRRVLPHVLNGLSLTCAHEVGLFIQRRKNHLLFPLLNASLSQSFSQIGRLSILLTGTFSWSSFLLVLSTRTHRLDQTQDIPSHLVSLIVCRFPCKHRVTSGSPLSVCEVMRWSSKTPSDIFLILCSRFL